MLRGTSQRVKRTDSRTKTNTDKHKQSKSKNKKFIQTPNISNHTNKMSTMASSPLIIKQGQSQKQNHNNDIFQTVVKILSKAARSKQKKILLSLASQVQKQKKIKKLLFEKQSLSQVSELQTLIAHLKQQQLKQIGSLRIEVGKRKLQNLDQHDLRQDILNLNSYVMRRSIRETALAKDKGIDLIGQIYNKFDEQDKQITSLITNLQKRDKSGSRLKLLNDQLQQQKNNKIRKRKSQTVCQSMITEIGKKTQKEEDRNLNQNFNKLSLKASPKSSQSQSQMMQKILQLQKQNLKLMKQIGKIQEQFQCVVEEKLLLEQKIQRMNINLQQKQRNQIVKKDRKDANDLGWQRQQKNGLITNYNSNCNYYDAGKIKSGNKKISLKNTNSISNLLSQSVSSSFEIRSRSDDCSNEQDSLSKGRINKNKKQENQDNKNMQELEPKFSQIDNQSLEKFQTILTQKQLQINKYLKTISNFNEQNISLKAQMQNYRHQLQISRQKQQILASKILKIRNQIRKIKQIYQLTSLEIKDYKQNKQTQVNKLLNHFQYLFNQKNNRFILKNQEIIQILVKQKRDLQDQKLRLNNDLVKLQGNLLQQIRKNGQDKQNLMQRINKVQKILQSQKIKSQQSSNTLRASLQNTNMENRILIDSKNQQIAFLKNKHQQDNRQIEYLNVQISQLNKRIKQVQCILQRQKQYHLQVDKKNEDNIAKLQQQLTQKINQLQNSQGIAQRYMQKITQMERTIQKQKDSMIQQFSMLIERKNDEIFSVRMLLQRQTMCKQDLLVRFSMSQNYKQKLKYVFQNQNQLKLQILQLRDNCAQLKKCIGILNNEMIQRVSEGGQKINEKIQSFLKQNFRQSLYKCKIQQGVINYNYVSCHEKHIIPEFISQIQSIIVNWLPLKIIMNLQPQSDIYSQKFKNIKQALTQLVKVAEQSKIEKQKQIKFVLDGNLKKNSISDKYDKDDLNYIDAFSPKQQQIIQSMNNSSFLSQFKPLQSSKLLFQSQINIQDLIKESGLVQEIQALKNQLAQSFKRNLLLEEQLKLYQQKDIDKIFDF